LQNATKKPPVWLAYTAAFLGVCSHASSEFFAKLSGLQGGETSVWRFMLGGAALLVVALLGRESRDLMTPLRKDFLAIVCLSLFGMALAQFIFHLSLDYASAVQVATMVTIMPIVVVFVARVVEGTPITTAKLISGIGAFLGCMLLLTDGYLAELQGSGTSLRGVLMALTCAILGATYLVLVKPYIQRYGAVRMTTYTFVLGFFALWTVVGLIWGNWVNPLSLPDRPPVQMGSILALGIWNTCIGFVLWFWGLSNVPDVARGNYLFFLKPVLALILAYFLLAETITATQLLAIFAITAFVAAEIFYDQIVAWRNERRAGKTT
jgi:drug/metabolite transporter (DMT)-like permease